LILWNAERENEEKSKERKEEIQRDIKQVIVLFTLLLAKAEDL
jgi:hypothetical protein